MTKSQLKYFQSLSLGKNRKTERKYLVEGQKSAMEWLAVASHVDALIVTEQWLALNPVLAQNWQPKIVVGLQHELDKISALATPTDVILVAQMPDVGPWVAPQDTWVLALDAIRDPGNMGTIIRIADWYGIKQIILSEDCVEVYNPKVVQASMGSLLRVQFYTVPHLAQTLLATDLPKYITHLDGADIRTLTATPKGIIVIGNESKGVSNQVLAAATQTVFIPRLGAAESLNAAVATGIVCHSLVLNK